MSISRQTKKEKMRFKNAYAGVAVSDYIRDTARCSPISLKNKDLTNIVRNVPLPVLDEYPIEKLSYTKGEFLAYSKEFPELSEHFELLHKIQSSSIPFSWSTVCVMRNSSGTFLNLVFHCKIENQEKVEQFLDSIGC